jgi:GrpB-like predicted nucleotidyltransferase (UPF0157 family)
MPWGGLLPWYKKAMPAPIPVELQPHKPEWAEAAARESTRLARALGENLAVTHHIGSTAIPGISAKPIVDIAPVVRDLSLLDHSRASLETLGYEWWGEYGISGRRYCTLNDPATGQRKIQLHCFQEGSAEIERHLAFRDYLRARADVAHEYEIVKCRCRELHPLDSHAYTDCKATWITQILPEAIAFHRAQAIRSK